MRAPVRNDLEFEEDSKFEILNNTVSIVEQLKNKKIRVFFDNEDKSGSKSSSREVSIRIGMKKGKVSAKTKLERELAKIVFDSPYEAFIRHVKNIRTNTTIDQRQSFIKNIYVIFDNLETRRAESCYGFIYRGANERFVEARPNDAKRIFPNSLPPTDPIEALKQARYDQRDLVKASEFAVALEYIDAVEMTDRKGAFELAILYWEKVVQPFLEKMLPKPHMQTGLDGKDFDEKNSNQENNDWENSKEEPAGKQDSSKTQSESTSSDNRQNIATLEDELAKTTDLKHRAMINTLLREYRAKEAGKNYTGHLLVEFSEPIKIWSGQKGDFEQKKQEHKESGKKEISRVMQQIEQITRSTTHSKFGWSVFKDKVIEQKPKHGKTVKFNQNVAITLKNIFKKVQGGRYSEVDSLGEDIDVEAYIEYKVNKIGNFHQSSRSHTGFDIVIAIDESGSMAQEMPKVRRMCATLYEAISGLQNVRLTIIGWTGTQEDCFVKKITRPSEISSLEATGLTPIGKAVWYSKHLIDLQTSPKRLFVLITDGQPNELKDIDIAKEGVKRMRKKGIMCSAICVGAETEKYSAFLQEIFGNEFAVCDNFTEVDQFLRKKITKQIINLLQVDKNL